MAGNRVDLTHRAVRVARAVAASSVATLAALGSHLAGGGAAPSLLLILAVCVLSWLPAVALIGRRLSVPGQAAVIAVSELALHTVFATGAAVPGGAPPGATAMPGMPGMAATSTPPLLPAGPVVHAGGGMWLAHAAAALLTLLLWNRGEGAFWALLRLAERFSRTVSLVELPAAVPESPTLVVRHPALPGFHLDRVLAQLARRGPPLSI
ncbi:MAG: hypothetical protein QOE37_472 [Microbacteriaceae bacterium]|nr:hypothetical protein [Microbacteriaceae bacterium]